MIESVNASSNFEILKNPQWLERTNSNSKPKPRAGHFDQKLAFEWSKISIWISIKEYRKTVSSPQKSNLNQIYN